MITQFKEPKLSKMFLVANLLIVLAYFDISLMPC